MSTALKSAKKDFLTKYFTRESLAPFINESIKKAQEQKREFGIVLVDLDHFKRFNDKYGHDIGDEVLEYAASTLRITLKGECHFFRYGGDEFILVFDKSRLWEIFNFMKICRFQYGIRHFLHGMKHFRVTFSCGIASFPRDGKTAAALIKRADEAMYFAKRYRGNLIIVAQRLKTLKWLHRFIMGLTICVISFAAFLVYYYLSHKEISIVIQ